MKTISKKVSAYKINMGGIYIDQALPHRYDEQVDPFLLIHHWSDELPGGERQEDLGVGPHPHRGFAPVTFIFEGGVHHRDSEGHESVVNEGGTQWMNSGRGIIHSERPKKSLAENGGKFEVIQFWVNAPAKNKMDAPKYQPLSNEETPFFTSEEGNIKVGVVAGEINDIKGPMETYSELLTLRLTYTGKGKITLPIPAHHNTLLYQLDGDISVNGQKLGNKEMVQFNNDGDFIEIETNKAGRAIILSGTPINEPLATHGPFVMNSNQELMEAIEDYQRGGMGHLVENFD